MGFWNVVAVGLMVFFTLVDLADTVTDFLLAKKLADAGFPGEAAWLAVMSTIALGFELGLKLPLMYQKYKGGYAGTDKGGLVTYVLFSTAVEAAVFLSEDTTALTVLYRAGIYDVDDAVSRSSVIFTLISAGLFVLGLLGSTGQVVRAEGCDPAFALPSVGPALVAAVVGFWGYLAAGVIMDGGWQHGGPGADSRLDGATTGLYVVSCLLATAAAGLGIVGAY